MNSILKSEIFFFITSIAVIVLSAVAAIALVYAIRILRNVSHVSKIVSEESDLIVKDVSKLREEAENNGVKIGRLLRMFKKYFWKYINQKMKK